MPKVLPPPDADTVTILGYDPPLPAVLEPGQHLNVNISYTMVTTNPVVIFARPYTDGRQTSSYMAHPLIKCEDGRGQVKGWFTFQKDARVDEVRVSMVDRSEKKVLIAATNKVEATWRQGPGP